MGPEDSMHTLHSQYATHTVTLVSRERGLSHFLKLHTSCQRLLSQVCCAHRTSSRTFGHPADAVSKDRAHCPIASHSN